MQVQTWHQIHVYLCEAKSVFVLLLTIYMCGSQKVAQQLGMISKTQISFLAPLSLLWVQNIIVNVNKKQHFNHSFLLGSVLTDMFDK